MPRNILLSYLDAFFFALMVGAGESYFTAYSLTLGHTAMQAGVLASAPIAIGGIIQLMTPVVLNRLKSYKFLICFCSFVQALLFIYLCQDLHHSYLMLFLIVSAYWSLFFISSSTWNAWIAQIIPFEKQVHFFTKRSMIMYFGILLGLSSAGISIHSDINTFSLIFLACFFTRLLSTVLLFFHTNQNVYFSPMGYFNIKLLKEIKAYPQITNLGIFVLIFKFGVFFSAPFYAPYMLEFLKFNYFEFMLVLAISFIGRVFIMRVIRNIVNENQVRLIFFIASICIAAIPGKFLDSWNLS